MVLIKTKVMANGNVPWFLLGFLRQPNLLALLAALPLTAHAQGAAYPNKPVRLIVAFSPGGLIDSIGRMVG